MKDNTDIRNIRLILNRYYNGNASGEDIKELKRFFTSAADVPSDLEADKSIFCMMDACDLTAADMEVPAGLEQTLAGIAYTSKPRRYHFVTIAAAAAALLLLISTGIYLLRPNTPAEAPAQKPVIAENPIVAPQTDAEAPAETTEIMASVPEPEASTPVKPQLVQNFHPAPAADPYIEITDSAEAARITVAVMLKMHRTMNMAMNTTEEITGKNIENISKVKQILDIKQ